MRKVITVHARLKRERISHEIQKSIAHAGWRFLGGERYHANLRYVENRSIPFSRRFARVTRTHFTGTSEQPRSCVGMQFSAVISVLDNHNHK